MGAPTQQAARRRFNFGGMQEKIQRMVKWMFTDTKVLKAQQKAEKLKSKERPDFGFND